MTSFDLRHGDCVEGLTGLPAATIDLVVTSPPYNLGIAYSRYSDRQTRGDYLEWCHLWATQLRRILKPDGSLFLNVGSAPSNPMLPHELVLGYATCSCSKTRSIDRRSRSMMAMANDVARPFQTDQLAALPQRLYEYASFTPEGRTRSSPPSAFPADKSNVAHWSHTAERTGAVGRVVRPYDDPAPGEGTTAPGDLSGAVGEWHQASGVALKAMLDPFRHRAFRDGDRALACENCRL